MKNACAGILGLAMALGTICPVAISQTGAERRLVPGQTVEAEDPSGEAEHVYAVDLETGQVLAGRIDGKGNSVDVRLELPGKSPYKAGDSGKRGTVQSFVAVAEARGTCRIRIECGGSGTSPGKYSITLDRVAEATERDRDLAEAMRLEGGERGLSLTEGVTRLKRAMELRERALGPDHRSVADMAIAIASWQAAFQPADDTEELCLKAIRILERTVGPEHPDLVQVLTILGYLAEASGEGAKALAVMERALAIAEKGVKGDDAESMAKCFPLAVAAGRLSYALGNPGRGETLFRRAIAWQEKTPGFGDEALAITLVQWASVSLMFGGNPASLIPHVERAIAILEKQEKEKGKTNYMLLSAALMSVVALYDLTDEKEKAAVAKDKMARATNEGMKAGGMEPVFLALNQALLLHGRGEYVAAMKLIEPVAARFLQPQVQASRPMPDPLSMLAVPFGLLLADLYRVSGDFAKAGSTLRQLEARISESVMLGAARPSILQMRALLDWARGDVPAAIASQARCNDLNERRAVRALAAGSARERLAQIRTARASEVDNTISLHVRAAPASPEASRLALESILQTKGRALDATVDSIAALRRRASPEDRALLDQLAAAQSKLSAATLSQAGGQDLAALEERVDELERQIGSASAELSAQLQPVRLDAVQRSIPQSGVLVEFAVYRPVNPRAATSAAMFGAPRYVAYVTGPSGDPRHVDLGETAAIDDLAIRLVAAMRDPRADVQPLARQLDERIMRPVRALTGSNSHLLVAPDGQLNLVPFAALVDEHGQYLVERFTITYLSSGRDLPRLGSGGGTASPSVVVADPDFGPALEGATPLREISHGDDPDLASVAFPPLPGAADEGRLVGELLTGARVLTRQAATEVAIKELAGPRILHVATHGFFLKDLSSPAAPPGLASEFGLPGMSKPEVFRNPMLRSGLVLAGANRHAAGGEDGILTAMELAGLDLWGTELVVLSACNTGVGDVSAGQGVFGMRRALLLAGSESQVMTLWPVSDVATCDLMGSYYRRILARDGRSDALRAVQMEFLKRKNRSHPFFWAAFIQSGAWAPLRK